MSTYLKKNELDNSILEDYFQSTFTQGDKEYIEEQSKTFLEVNIINNW